MSQIQDRLSSAARHHPCTVEKGLTEVQNRLRALHLTEMHLLLQQPLEAPPAHSLKESVNQG
ncbi:hypothetical protein EYF80_039346 [Liparis tanakae]|uniref:Uncharacterized protein n=1 Tax=Liparis tanakae TaxID=230148 RepID=A0A4Z2GB24_9TELE|nr:hypothetical protein EYF80_039346 [Liparis tanakae]